MAINRVTQRMMTDRSVGGMQQGLSRMAKLHEQLSTGRVLNRPSDNPTDTTSAMRLRDSLAASQQFQRNADDGLAWLGRIDTALDSATGQLNRTRELALQGASSGSMGPAGREALATEIEQIRAGLLADANTTYLGRPVFGGVTGGPVAFDTTTGAWAGTPGAVNRTVGENVQVQVDVDGRAAFGPDGDSVFDHLQKLADDLRTNNAAGITAGLASLSTDLDRISTTRAQAGSRFNRIESALDVSSTAELTLKTSLSDVENADLAKTVVDLQMQEVAYQAALGATSRVMQPSLLDFLR